MMRSLTTKEICVAIVFAMLVFSAVPFFAAAQTNIDAGADAMCNPVMLVCGCMMKMGPKGCEPGPNMWQCPCQGAKTSGICTAPNKCKATSFKSESGQAGGAPGMDQLMSALKGLMDALKGGGGGGSPPPPPSTGGAGDYSSGGYPGGCTTYYQTSVQGSSDPCSYYVPSYNSSSTDPNNWPDINVNNGCTTFTETSDPNDSNPCSFYVPAIPTGSNTPSGSGDCTTFTRTTNPEDKRPCTFFVGGSTSTEPGKQINQASPPSFFNGFLNGVIGMRGFQGDIKDEDGNGTVFGGINDFQANSGFGSFVGSRGSMSGSSVGLVGKLCITRPWTNAFVSFLIKPSFFDNLCTSRGYQLGAPMATQESGGSAVRNTVPTKTSTTTPPPPPRNYIPPQADIWAVPSAVSIGARTSVFWNTRGVVECLITSPDGNFTETALSGGASTVPIVGPIEFTITCKAPDGTEVKNSVLVTLKI